MIDAEELKTKRNLRALVELSRTINSSLNLDFILNNLLLTCMGKFLSTRGFIALKTDSIFQVAAKKGFNDEQLINLSIIKTKDELKSEFFKQKLNSLNILVWDEICSSNECIGLIALGEKLNKQPYSSDDLEFLHTITNIAAPAIKNSLMIKELKKTNRTLDSKVTRLNSLFELSKEFGLFSESVKVTRLLIYSVIGQFLVQKFAVVSLENKELRILESKFPHDVLLAELKKATAFNITNSLNKLEINQKYPELGKIGIELIVPMQLKGETKGLIILGKRISGLEYTDDDIEYIYAAGSLAIISLENQRLFKEELEKQKLEEDLEIAREIQRNLLPQKLPKLKKFDIAASTVFSKQVGGDYYDVITLNKKCYCIAIADVAGKGVSAALLMANLQAFLKTICRRKMKIDDATGLINDLVSENTTEGKFITFFWAVLDDEKKLITYVNAGHNPPFLIRKGKIEKLDKGGIILGVMKTMIPYQSESLQLEKDDLLILFTDGVSEAMNKNNEEFSEKRLEELSLACVDKSANEIATYILSHVKDFTAGAVQSDDITLMVIKVK